MKINTILCCILLCIHFQIINSQNLLDTSTWTVGTGSVSGFGQNGSTSENIRELHKNHVGSSVVVWKAIPDDLSNADGGWNSDYIPIDNTKKYRLGVWVKKTNSHNGNTYLGCNSHNGSYQIYRLDGTLDANPYFFVGDLPKLNRWYLIVGFVHEKTYTGTEKLGGVYDGVTGQKVRDTQRDFRFGNTADDLMHRSYLFYDTNTSDRQYFWEPRIDQVTGSEPSIRELLQVNEDAQLIFGHDTAGNQAQLFYCDEANSCTPSVQTVSNANAVKAQVAELEPDLIDDDVQTDNSINEYTIYPNPTSGNISVSLKGTYSSGGSMCIYSLNGSLVKKIHIDSSTDYMNLDLSDKPSGMYVMRLYFTNGNIVTKKIIKK